MAHALTLTLKLKQDAASQKALQALKAAFAGTVQPAIDAALRESKLVHFARVVVIDNQYLQVLTEYDGDKGAYAEFFRLKLPKVFAAIFSLAEGVPPWDQMDKQTFFQISQVNDLPALGDGIDDPGSDMKKTDGYLFSAYGLKAVKEILPKL